MKTRNKLILLTAAAMCLSQESGMVEAAQNMGSIPPPKVEQGSHVPISILDFADVTWPAPSEPGKDIPVHFSIVNNGTGPAKNILIRAESQDLDALVPKSNSNVNAKFFAPKQKLLLYFPPHL